RSWRRRSNGWASSSSRCGTGPPRPRSAPPRSSPPATASSPACGVMRAAPSSCASAKPSPPRSPTAPCASSRSSPGGREGARGEEIDAREHGAHLLVEAAAHALRRDVLLGGHELPELEVDPQVDARALPPRAEQRYERAPRFGEDDRAERRARVAERRERHVAHRRARAAELVERRLEGAHHL